MLKTTKSSTLSAEGNVRRNAAKLLNRVCRMILNHHLRIERPNQVWCADVTYIPMQRGFLYLVAIRDWAIGMPCPKLSKGLARDDVHS